MSTIPTKPIESASVAESTEEHFQRLAATWRAETGYLSSSNDLFIHPAYQEIIHMGLEVVPLLLRDLEKEPEQWSWALQMITGANPVPPEDSGNLDRMARAWLHWGRQHGLR